MNGRVNKSKARSVNKAAEDYLLHPRKGGRKADTKAKGGGGRGKRR